MAQQSTSSRLWLTIEDFAVEQPFLLLLLIVAFLAGVLFFLIYLISLHDRLRDYLYDRRRRRELAAYYSEASARRRLVEASERSPLVQQARSATPSQVERRTRQPPQTRVVNTRVDNLGPPSYTSAALDPPSYGSIINTLSSGHPNTLPTQSPDNDTEGSQPPPYEPTRISHES